MSSIFNKNSIFYKRLNNKKLMILDTETNGLHHSRNLLSIGWIILTDTDDILFIDWIEYYLRKINNNIDTGREDIHGLTREKLNSEGIEMNDILDKFKEDLKNIDIIIAHNVDFDIGTIKNELKNHNRKDILNILNSKIYFCSLIHFRFLRKNGKHKLEDLYHYCFNKFPEYKTHIASEDVKILMDVIKKFY
jgi:DNA polymerase III epsilon subunit-like protein